MPCSPHIQQQSPILTRFPASVQSHHKFPEAYYTISPRCNPGPTNPRTYRNEIIPAIKTIHCLDNLFIFIPPVAFLVIMVNLHTCME